MMSKFTVIIEETIAESFVIEAENEIDALNIAQKKYKTGEFVLCNGEVQHKQIGVVAPYQKNIQWYDF